MYVREDSETKYNLFSKTELYPASSCIDFQDYFEMQFFFEKCKYKKIIIKKIK